MFPIPKLFSVRQSNICGWEPNCLILVASVGYLQAVHANHLKILGHQKYISCINTTDEIIRRLIREANKNNQ